MATSSGHLWRNFSLNSIVSMKYIKWLGQLQNLTSLLEYTIHTCTSLSPLAHTFPGYSFLTPVSPNHQQTAHPHFCFFSWSFLFWVTLLLSPFQLRTAIVTITHLSIIFLYPNNCPSLFFSVCVEGTFDRGYLIFLNWCQIILSVGLFQMCVKCSSIYTILIRGSCSMIGRH